LHVSKPKSFVASIRLDATRKQLWKMIMLESLGFARRLDGVRSSTIAI